MVELQCKKQKHSISTQPSPVNFEHCQIFSRRKVGTFAIFIFGGWWLCKVSNFDKIFTSVVVQSQISFAHFCNIDRIKYLKFEPSTTSHCENFVLNFERNHGKVRSWCNFYELPFEVLEMCFLHCRDSFITESSNQNVHIPLYFVYCGNPVCSLH